ncbi:MAG: NrtA/SsuA/CpmA family ABC transporter substrate-binding protein, partial [Chlorobium sp.]|nr:NrtA/SsuA/CpmA family ABC transporter substrate-binding protein [Chlorobium sp.]
MILLKKNHLPWMLAPLLLLLVVPDLSRAEEQPTLRFADQDRIGSVIPILAANKGFFVEEGLRVAPMRFNNGPACAEALYTGAADIGSIGDAAAIILTGRNPKFVIIGSLATGEHRHRIMVRKDETLQTIQDLRGKRLGVKKGTSTHGGLLVAMAKAGLSPTDLDIIDLSPSTSIDALLAGSLDAI